MADSPSSTPTTQPFDIVSKYHSLLSADPDLTPPIAAIESLIALLTSSPATTVSETLDLLSHSSATLRASVPNWIALSAGTDLFQRYLIQTLNRPGALGTSGDFNYLRQHLLSNSRLFVQRAKKARARIAEEGSLFIREGSTVLTNGDSRVVSALLLRAAESKCHFRVIYVLPSPPQKPIPEPDPLQHHRAIPTLRNLSIPVAIIPYSALATALPIVDLVLVGAEGVVESGGIISRLGTYQVGLLARSMGKPMYVAAESYKFVRLYPLHSGDGELGLPVRQRVVRFEPEEEDRQDPTRSEQRGKKGEDREELKRKENLEKSEYTWEEQGESREDESKLGQEIISLSEAVDFTPPNLISALITENGVLTPGAVSEELIKLWF